jgi:plastocyanin
MEITQRGGEAMKKQLFICGIAVATAALVGSNAYGSRTTTKKASLRIVHVEKGCHVFSGSMGNAATMRLSIARGGLVTMRNRDVDGHTLVQTAGPVKLTVRSLKMNGLAKLTFKKAGRYTFVTKTFELEGMPEMETMGKNNMLRLIVVVK